MTIYKRVILTIGLLACMVSFLFLFYQHEHPAFKLFFFNSDALYLPVLFQHLFEQHGQLNTWYLTPAPYFFPDFVIFLPAYVLGASASVQMAYVTFFQVLLLGFCLYFFFKKMNVSNCTIISGTLLAMAVLLGLAFQYASEFNPFSYLLVSTFHYGSFLIEIVCLALVVQRLKSPFSRFPIIALCGFSFLMACSDALFLVQCVLPMMLSLAIMMIYCPSQRSKKNVIWLLLPLGAALIGFLIYPQIVAHPTRYSNQLSVHSIVNNFYEMKIIFQPIFQRLPAVIFFLAIFYVIIFFIVSMILIKKRFIYKKIRHFPCFIFLSFFSLLSMIIPIIIMLLMANFIPTPRYFIPIVSLPIIISIGYAAIALKKYAHLFTIGSVFIMLGYLGLQALYFYQSDSATHATRYYPQDIACIDESLAKYPLLRHGIAQYWDAKFIQAYSRKNLVMAQYDKNLTEDRWITSEQFYQTAYDFAVIHTNIRHPNFILSRKKIANHNHSPLEEIQCGQYTILIYPKNTLKTRAVVSPGDKASWKACELPFVLGHPTISGAVHADHIKKTEFITYGPYELLSAGSYEFEISYSSSKSHHKQAGTWEIVSAETQKPLLFQKGVYWGTKGRTQRIKGIFNIVSKHFLTKIEIRTKAFPGKWFQVNQLTIKRLK